ncbi:MAG TPA: sugar ABC transporter permease [Candidatus Limnocylindrales bacterium]|nr:sugar ABC transporter permease [Candidatus Limnocylindrales bacterium]
MAATPATFPRRRTPRLGLGPLARREALWGYFFLSPWIIGFLSFVLVPMVVTLIFTFTNVNLSQEEPLAFVGLDNWMRLLSDSGTWSSLLVTLKFAAIQLPVMMVVPFAIALLLNSPNLRASGLFRVLFFLPYVVPFVAGVFVWEAMLNSETGWVNAILEAIGVARPPNWLNDTGWIYPGLVIMGIWGIGGGIIVNLAGLKSIPSELYDAARVDGAGWWSQLRHVTIPLMSPVIFFTLILGIVEVLQYFLVPLVLKNGNGEPGGATLFYNLYLYKTFYTFQNMSYGSTLAWLLFLITLAITFVVFRLSRRWVYYAGER